METIKQISERFMSIHKNDNIEDWCTHIAENDKPAHIYHEIIMADAVENELDNGDYYIEISKHETKSGSTEIFEFEPVNL